MSLPLEQVIEWAYGEQPEHKREQNLVMQVGFVKVDWVESLVHPEGAHAGEPHHLDGQRHQENEPELELVVPPWHQSASQELTNDQKFNDSLGVFKIERLAKSLVMLSVECWEQVRETPWNAPFPEEKVINIKHKNGNFEPIIPPLRVVHLLVKELPEDGVVEVSTHIVHLCWGLSNSISASASKAGPHEILRDRSLTEEGERQCHQNLKPNNNNDGGNELFSSKGVLDGSQETWEDEHDASLHWQS